MALGQRDFGDSLRLSPLGPLVAVLAVVLGALVVRATVRGTAIRWSRPALALGVTVVALSWAFQLTQGAGS
jgi:hypothetical protein